MIKQYKLCKRQNNFDITLYYKNVKVRVQFTGGNTYKGVLPKCFEKDPFKQRAIEASQMFKNREIVLERTIEEPGDKNQAVAVQTKKIIPSAVQTKKVVKPVAPKPAPKPEPPNVEKPTAEIEPPTFEQSQGEDDGTKQMEFGNLGEAILYIAQNYQVQVTTDKEAREILKQNGITPKIKRDK